jgi:hypothetical protein
MQAASEVEQGTSDSKKDKGKSREPHQASPTPTKECMQVLILGFDQPQLGMGGGAWKSDLRDRDQTDA